MTVTGRSDAGRGIRRAGILLMFALLIMPGTAYAHGGDVLTRDQVLRTWTWSPVIFGGLVLFVALYSLGVHRLWNSAGPGRGVGVGRVLAFAGAIVSLVAAIFSPLDALSDQLFTAHMVQHMLLMFVAAPLLVIGGVPVAVLWALPRSWARAIARGWRRAGWLVRLWSALTQPVVASILFALALWLWHVPALYDAALRHEWIHSLEHAAFYGTALVFWWAVADLNRPPYRHAGASLIYLFAALLHSGVLGALLTFSGRGWYADYAATSAAWGLTQLEDQQLGGVIMWAPGHLIFTAIIIVVFYRWLSSSEAPGAGSVRAGQRRPTQA